MSMSIADAIRHYHEIKLPPGYSVDNATLDEEVVDILDRIKSDTDVGMLAGQLAASLRTLWVARQSGEQTKDDTDAMLCLLSEVASLLEYAIETHDAADWLLDWHKKAAARAG